MAPTLTTMPGRQAAARQRYVTNSVETHSPARLVTMLYDKMVSELERAEIMGPTDLFAWNEALVRCEAIVLELRASLDVSAWDGGPGLAALYDFFVREIIQANITRDIERVRSVRALIEPLRDAWHQAAAQLNGAH